MRILLDVMGGDLPPCELVAGGVAAGCRHSIDILFVGDPEAIRAALNGLGESAGGRFGIVPSSEVILMDDSPVRAVREKKNSSLLVGLAALKSGTADAFVSPGNTGAVVAGSLFTLGRVPGIPRPGLLAVLPSLRNQDFVVIDVGATADCAPEHLEAFALMGASSRSRRSDSSTSAKRTRREIASPTKRSPSFATGLSPSRAMSSRTSS
jgi:glycerol-3-phosphate acyltransferase PlsX